MASERLGASFSIDITQLQAGLKTANRLIRESQSEFRSAAAGLDDWSKSEQGLNARISSLNQITTVQREKVRALTASYEKLIDEGLDPASDRAIQLRTQINNEKAALAQNEAELKRNQEALKGLGRESDNAGGKLEKLGSIAKAAGAAIAASLAAAGTAVVGLVKSAVDAYANYEQLVGGVETLFGTGGQSIEEYAQSVGKSVDEVKDDYAKLESAQTTVLNNAAGAFKTAGMSANEYMETVTSFSASLISSLGGDTVKAAEYADRAITDMSDNANKMGTDIGSIQYAYQGFAKQNYTMLDNLKLGYGGNQTEMARLIKDASKMTDVQKKLNITVEEGDMSFANIVNAISVVQSNLGIMGTTAKEASTTIQGSLHSMKSAWQNVLTGMADESQDIDALILDLVDSIGTFAENLLPRVSVVMDGLIKMIEKLLPQIPPLLQQFLPVLLEGVTNLMHGVVQILPQVVDTIMEVVPQLITALIGMLPTLMQTVVDIVVQIINALSTMMPTIVDAIMEILPILVTSLINAIPQLLQAAITFLMAIVEAIPTIVEALVTNLPMIIDTIVNTLIQNLPMIINAAIQLFMGIIKAIPQIQAALVKNLPTIIRSIVDGLIKGIPELIKAGGQLLAGLFEGLLDPKVIWNNIKAMGNSILDGIKGFFKIKSPSKVMESVIGKNLALGIGEGFENNVGEVNNQIAKAFDLQGMAAGAKAAGADVGRSGSVVVNQYNTFSNPHSRYELYRTKQETAAAVRLAMGGV